MNECTLPTTGGKVYDCPKLRCRMTPAWCNLYYTDSAYAAKWDAGKGPGQNLPTGIPITRPVPQDLPPLREQVIGFLGAMAKFVADGCRVVDGAEFDRRVAVCMECEYFIRRPGRCSQCGCCGKLKAKGRVWACPKHKW